MRALWQKPPHYANIWIRCIFWVPFLCLLPPDQFCIRPLCFHYNLAARAPLNKKSEWKRFFPLAIYFPLGSLAHYCSFLEGKKNPKKTVFGCEAVLLILYESLGFVFFLWKRNFEAYILMGVCFDVLYFWTIWIWFTRHVINFINFILMIPLTTTGKIKWSGDAGVEKADRRQFINAGERL